MRDSYSYGENEENNYERVHAISARNKHISNDRILVELWEIAVEVEDEHMHECDECFSNIIHSF